jgi:hypothetical protein
MALAPRAAIGMPPDGSGKPFNVDYTLEIDYVSATGSFIVNEEVTGQTTGLVGTVTRINVEGPSTGEIFVLLHPDDILNNFQVGESLLVNGVPVAQVGSVHTLYTQRAQVVGGNNPFNAQFVDRQGAASVRFAEGSTQFDGFGRMNVANLTSIGDYQSHYGLNEEVWYTNEVGTGSVAYVPAHAGALLSTSMADGDIASITTHKYHPYQAGTGQQILVTAYTGDTGKVGVTRRWGYFDDNDGLFFQLKDNTLSVVVRSSVTGSVVERVYPQADWNNDRFDGTGTSQLDLDLTKHNLYWINFAWLGVGVVRFGVYGEDGARLVAHVVQNGNIRQEPYLSNPRLPIRYEIENTTTQGSTTELFAGCAAVMVEGSIAKQHKPMGGADVPLKTITGTGVTPLAAARSMLTYAGARNRIMALPQDIDIQAFHTGTDNPARIKFLIIKNPTVTGQTWIPVPSNAESSLEFEPSSTTPITDGETILATLVHGEKTMDLTEKFNLSSDQMLQRGAGPTAPEYYFAAVPIDPTDSIDVSLAFNWSEI